MVTKKSLGNLKPAKKGEIRNPNGRPPKIKTIPDILRKIGSEKMPPKVVKMAIDLFPDAPNMTMLEAALRMCYIHAIKGVGWAVEFIAERTEGKITQPVDISPFDSIDHDKLDELPLEDLKKLAGYFVEMDKAEKAKKNPPKPKPKPKPKDK